MPLLAQRPASVPSSPSTPPKPAARRLSSPNPNARRLSGGAQGRRLSGWRPEDVENFFEENDDEQERQKAAAEAQQAKIKKAARSPFRATPGHERRLQMYKECITMTTENKVNEKNSWSLDFIDHMGHMLSEQDGNTAVDATGGPNFQMASTTLDAGVKIFSYRVDSVFTNAYKLLSGLNRGAPGSKEVPDDDDLDKENEGEEGADGEGGASEGAEKANKKVSAKKAAAIAAALAAGTAHIEDNPAALNLKKLDVAFDVDPLFHQTSAKFDEGGAKGLLLNNLNVHQGTSLVFDSSDAPSPADGAAGPLPSAPAPPVPTSAIAALLPKSHESLHVAKPFVDFWNTVRPGGPITLEGDEEEEPEEEAEEEPEEPEMEAPPTPATPPGGEEGEYAPFEPAFDNDSDDEIDDATRMREEMLENQLENGDEESAAAVMSLDELANDRERRASLGGGGGMVEEDALAPEVQMTGAHGQLTDQARKLLDHGWAGNNGWKFPNHPGRPQRPPGVRKPKAAFLIDFSKRGQIKAELDAAPLDVKGTTQMTAAARAKARATETKLPHDYHCNVDSLEKLFDKPAHCISYSTKRVQKAGRAGRSAGGEAPEASSSAAGSGWSFVLDDDDEPPPVTNFDDDDVAYDGGGDFGPIDNDDDGDFGGGDAGQGEPPLAGEAQEALASAGFDFIAAPTKVAKINIGYARRATQVDIKQLKVDVWSLLQEAPDAGSGGGKNGKVVSFQTVLSKLHEKVPEKALGEISFAYCFICLLHLANEKGLEVLGEGDMKDMSVRMPAAAK